jgi:hypothetical protein
MNSLLRTPAPARRRTKKCFVPLGLVWTHLGASCRVTPWPEVRFERCYGDEWIPFTPSVDALASAALGCSPAAWRAYLEFVPAEVAEFLLRFRHGRMEALQVAARCPELVATLAETPALTAFVAAHASLRGAVSPAWDEINAIHERNGIFGVMEWLGLPASRQTLSILRAITEPDVPKRLLEPLRSQLWEPRSIFLLQRLPAITDRQLAHFCHALAA